MPSNSRFKCYFGCENDGPLHRFPKPEYPHMDKFNTWKMALGQSIGDKSDTCIYNQIRICNKHFQECFLLPSRRLTANAVPTLNICSTSTQNSLDEIIVRDETTATGVREQIINLENRVTTSTCSTSTQHSSHEIIVRDEAAVIGVQEQITNLKNKTDELEDKNINKKSKLISGLKQITSLKNKLTKLSTKYKLQKKKLLAAQQLSMSKKFLKMVDGMPETSKTFMSLQFKYNKKPKGRRYTIDEKIMALTIYKQSPKAYKLLKKLFVLPSQRNLQKMLASLQMRPGINPDILENLKHTVRKMPAEKKLVTLIFDEVSLSPGLFYNTNLKEITGFEDFGTDRTKKIADHALVFMIKGLKGKVKQPICFTFCQSTTKKEVLKQLLKRVIKEINETGLTVVATVCDQSTTNVRVIKDIEEETKRRLLIQEKEYRSKAVLIDDLKVYPLYDPPHLLKGVRNNLLTKDVQYKQNGKVKTAKWEHLEMLLKIDTGEDEIRLVNKLTELHVNKDKIPKMKVKYAAQVFSQRVSAAMRFLARHKILPTECEETADFLLIIDKLFDSFNGSSYEASGKIFKGCLKNRSPHFQLWDELLPILKTVQFKTVTKKTDGTEVVKFVKVPSIHNWIHNIETIKEMWEYLKNEHNITSIMMRNLNQDPLENFFSNIRSNGIRNINPTCMQFINVFKTLIINNFNSPHSPGANCEHDDNQSFQSLKSLLKNKPIESNLCDYACDIDSLISAMHEMKSCDHSSLLHLESKKYVVGYVIKKCKTKIFKNCQNCIKALCRSQIDIDSFNYEVDYTKKSLFHPSDQFISLMNEIYNVIVICLRESPEVKLLKNKVKFYINCVCDFNIITCTIHKSNLIELIISNSINLIIHSWCNGINRILQGKISSFDQDDLTKQHAFEYCKKHKRS